MQRPFRPAGAMSVIALLFFQMGLQMGCTRTISLRIIHGDAWNGRVTAENVAGTWVGGAPLAVALLDELRSEAESDGRTPVALNVGSSLFGSREAWFTRGSSSVTFMNLVGIQAMGLGNREFDLGASALVPLAQEARFPFLAANLLDEMGKLPPFAKSHVILPGPRGSSLAVFGFLLPQMSRTMQKSSLEGLHLENPADSFRRLMRAPDFRGADYRILLLNSGASLEAFEADFARDMASQVHLVVRRFWSGKPPGEPTAMAGVPVVMAEPYGKSVGVYDVDFSLKTRRVVDASWKIREVNSLRLEPSRNAARRLAALQAELESSLARVVGSVPQPLHHDFVTSSPLGNLVCDVIRSAIPSDLAVVGSGGLRPHLDTSVTVGSLFQAIPFDNNLVTLRMRGTDLKALFSESVDRAAVGSGILQVSTGVRVRWDPRLAAGKRLVDVWIDGQPLLPEREYQLATTDFLAEGGDGFRNFQKGHALRTWNLRLRDTVSTFIEQGQALRWSVGSPRIVVTNARGSR